MAAAAFLMSSFVLARAAAAEDVGWVAALEGTAELQRGGVWSGLTQGGALQLGDHVRTAVASRVKLLFRDDSVLTLAERSELMVDEQVAGAAPTSSFSLLLGQVRAIVTDRYSASGAKFEVKSPTAIAGVRGTSFIAAYDRTADETQVIGLEDVTAVRGLNAPVGAEVRVGPGEATTVRRGAMPTPPVKMPGATIQSLRNATSTKGGQGDGGQTAADPRLPRRPSERAGSPEGRVIDQPIELLRKGPVTPPPPPVP